MKLTPVPDPIRNICLFEAQCGCLNFFLTNQNECSKRNGTVRKSNKIFIFFLKNVHPVYGAELGFEPTTFCIWVSPPITIRPGIPPNITKYIFRLAESSSSSCGSSSIRPSSRWAKTCQTRARSRSVLRPLRSTTNRRSQIRSRTSGRRWWCGGA